MSPCGVIKKAQDLHLLGNIFLTLRKLKNSITKVNGRLKRHAAVNVWCYLTTGVYYTFKFLGILDVLLTASYFF